ncbi:aminoglycoside phosphotransferase [Pseudonocardia sp. HH130630-07]|nr:aminoglycoside phosphotransferase [Pseudonocardia sp. HH130630-07]
MTRVPGASRSLHVLRALRRGGHPVPAVEAVVPFGPDVVWVQEVLPGAPVRHVTHVLLDDVLSFNAGMDRVALPGVPAADLYLLDDGPGFCLHEPLRRYDRRSARLDARVRAVGRAHHGALPGTAAVHLDFHPGNLLTDGRRLSGVVDWGGAARGDRRFDLVTFRFGLLRTPAEPGVVERVDRILDGLAPDLLVPAWAHMSLRMTDWSIRHFGSEETERWMDLAETRDW